MNIFIIASIICGIATKVMSNLGNDSMLMVLITTGLMIAGLVTSKEVRKYL